MRLPHLVILAATAVQPGCRGGDASTAALASEGVRPVDSREMARRAP